jgi:hypothetical protein
MPTKPARRIARGERNRNPGNIRKTGDWRNWQGVAPDREQVDEEFIVFKTAAWGIRALARTLITYRDKHNLRTIAGIINRWAPPIENDTGAYAMAVSEKTGIGLRQPIDIAKYEVAVRVIPAIIHQELGYMPYSREQIDEGLRMAGIAKPVPPVTQDPRLRTGAVAGAGATAVIVTETLQVGRELRDAGKTHESAALTIGGGLIVLVALGALAVGVLRKRKAKKE